MDHESCGSSSGSDGSSDVDCDFEAMELPHIPGAAADVVAAAAAAGLIDCIEVDDVHVNTAASAILEPVGGRASGAAFHEEIGSILKSENKIDDCSSSDSSNSSSDDSGGSSSDSDGVGNDAAVAAMLEVDSDDEVLAEPVVAAAQVRSSM